MPFGLQAFDAGIVTRRLELPEISVDSKRPVTLLVRHAGTTNRAWDNLMLRTPMRPATATPAAGQTPEQLAADRVADRNDSRARTNAILAEAIIVGWENVTEDGQPVAWSPAGTLRFMAELAEHCPDVWARIQMFASSVSNFRGAEVDPVDLGKG